MRRLPADHTSKLTKIRKERGDSIHSHRHIQVEVESAFVASNLARRVLEEIERGGGMISRQHVLEKDLEQPTSDKRSVLYLNPTKHYCRGEVIKSLRRR